MIKEIAISATMVITPFFAQAQQPIGSIPFYSCGQNEQMEQTLTEKYGEVAVYGGTSSAIHLDRYWVNAETGSWSNTRTNIQSGVTCILTSGGNAVALEPAPEASY